MVKTQFLVIAEAKDSIVGADVARLRAEVGAVMKRIQASGKLIAGGVVVGRRMPVFLLDVESNDELFDLLRGEIADNFDAHVYPLISFEHLAKFFQENPV